LVENKTFPEADHSCRFEQGAQLTSIHSQSELEFVALLSVNQMHNEHYGAWIGLHRPVGAQSTWESLDGSELDFTNWSDIDGNTKLENARSDQQWCVVILNSGWIQHKQWNFQGCDYTESAVCKKQPR
ncbi:Lectoxin-Lio1, partial [Aphelenchoides avenae]